MLFRILLVLIVLAGGWAGWLGGRYLATDPAERRAGEINLTLQLDGADAWVDGVLVEGWSEPDAEGIWSAAPVAQLALTTERDPVADLELLLDASARPAPGQDHVLVSVLINGEDLGSWAIRAGGDEQRRRFIVPQSVAARRQPIEVALAIGGAQPGAAGGNGAAVGLRKVTLRDPEGLGAAAGHVDACNREVVAGWAAMEGLGLPVTVKVNGTVAAVLNTLHERPDLPAVGLPSLAGFHYKWPEPASSGSEVEIVFPNGRPVGRGPCQL